MIRRHVLAALSTGVTAGDDDLARKALDRIDWILRGWARRRLEHALIDASLATGAHDDDPASVRHRLRAAALIVDDRGDRDLGDRDAVAAAYAQVAATAAPRLPLATIAAALGAATIAVVMIATAVAIVAAAPDVEFTRPAPPPPVGAFRDGGAPERDPAIQQLLVAELPILVANQHRRRSGGAVGVERPDRSSGAHRSPIATLRDHPAVARYPALAEAWRGMIDQLPGWLDRDPGDPGFRRAATELRARVDVVSDQLAAASLGYYLAPMLVAQHGRPAGIYAYRIDEVAFVRADRARVRVLGMRRLDPLGDDVARLGMATEELDDPVVLLDQVDAKVEHQILPVLYGAPYPLGDDGWGRSRAGREIAIAAGDAIRRELMTALGTDVELVERATQRCRRVVAESVRHHEAQHALDHGHRLRHPPQIAGYVGAPSGELALRTRLELSGYLSQIASDVWLPQLVLWNLSRHAFRRPDARAAAEAYVAVAIVEGLARRLGVRAVGPVIHHGAIDRERLAALVGPLAAEPTTGLRSAAAALWRELFDEKLARMVDDPRR